VAKGGPSACFQQIGSLIRPNFRLAPRLILSICIEILRAVTVRLLVAVVLIAIFAEVILAEIVVTTIRSQIL
jgi:hypothetical protein